MKNNKGFTLIELLAVIVVLAIVTVIATQSVLPFMTKARPDAFGIEATNVVKAAENANNFYNLGKITLDGNSNSCVKGNVVCFTVAKLIDSGLYDGDKNVYQGKVLVDVSNASNPTYTLYLQKGAEFKIVGSNKKDFTLEANKVDIKDGGFTDAEKSTAINCSCS